VTKEEMILDEIKGLRADIQGLMLNGCSRAGVHQRVNDDHETRLRDLETTIAETRGAGWGARIMTAALCGVVSLLSTVLGIWAMLRSGRP
jgi:hypothetical protein